MSAIVIGLSILLLYAVIHRYKPVQGLQETEVSQVTLQEGQSLVDVRHFQASHRKPVDNSVSMPLAYLTRHYRNIVDTSVYIIAGDYVEVNLSAKFLRKKGYNVAGYTIIPYRDHIGKDIASGRMREVCKES